MQEVEYVKQRAKIVLRCSSFSRRRPGLPSVRIKPAWTTFTSTFAQGVEAVAIHGGKSQEERDYGITEFKAERKDVLVATDVAAKGLDFPNIQHVINYDMPEEIENYVQASCRLDRSRGGGKTASPPPSSTKTRASILLDLKHLLRPAKQRIAIVLAMLEDPADQAEQVASTGTKRLRFADALSRPSCRDRRLSQTRQPQGEAIAGAGRKDFFGAGRVRRRDVMLVIEQSSLRRRDSPAPFSRLSPTVPPGAP